MEYVTSINDCIDNDSFKNVFDCTESPKYVDDILVHSVSTFSGDTLNDIPNRFGASEVKFAINALLISEFLRNAN